MTDEPFQARYDVGIDSYRAAKILIDRHGRTARAQAIVRRQRLAASGNLAGAAAWADILHAVEVLQAPPGPAGERH